LAHSVVVVDAKVQIVITVTITRVCKVYMLTGLVVETRYCLCCKLQPQAAAILALSYRVDDAIGVNEKDCVK